MQIYVEAEANIKVLANFWAGTKVDLPYPSVLMF